jgi:serine/threonine-protein kinase
VTSGQPTNDGQHLARLLPEYSIERELGRGAMGVVYLARHQRLDRLVAVKELQGALAADQATRERFVVEAKALATLNHPHVVPVYDYIERDDRCVLIMEQLPGGTVWDQFVATGLTMPQATAITLATCSAMQHAHDQGVLHRDIKPENLMFDVEGVLKVTDFGIARMVNGASTKATVAGSVLGTPAYMAPEQAEGKNVGPPADVYATATMFYEMLSGRLPFESSDSLVGMLTQRITSDPLSIAEVAPQVPGPIAAVVMNGLVRAVPARAASAELFGTMLGEAAAESWGPTWLDASGIVVRGSERIDRAARTLRSGEAQRPTPGADSTTGGARGTVVAGTTPDATDVTETSDVAGRESAATMLPNHPAMSDEGTPPPELSSQPAPAPSPESSPPPSAPPQPTPAVDLTPVKPQSTDRDLGRARADQIDQLIDISEVLAPPARPVAQYVIAAALFVAGLVWALVGGSPNEVSERPATELAQLTVNGDSAIDPADPIEIDLGEPIVIDGIGPGNSVSMSFSQMGVPVGSTDTFEIALPGPAPVDAGFLGNVTSGAMTATVEVTDAGNTTVIEVEFPATATNPWFLTAAGVISILLILFSVAGIESNLRAFRRGRGGVTSFGGLVITGALLGASASGALTIIAGTERGTVGVIGPAVLCAIGAVTLGLATRANRQRRRAAKQALRHTAIKALASR